MILPEVAKWVAATNVSIQAGAFDSTAVTRPLAERLIRLDRLMRSAPSVILHAFARLAETELVVASEQRMAELDAGDWRWGIPLIEDPAAIVFAVGVEVRATDSLLRHIRSREAPVKADTEYRHTALKALVVPCRERRVGRSGDRERQGYERRGILKHRILPTMIQKFRVKLSGGGTVDLKAPVGPPAFRGGAALFEGLKLKTVSPSKGLFLVEGCDAVDKAGQIERNLTEAHHRGGSALVWPELTLTPSERTRIVHWLQNRLFREVADESAVDIVVTGSWHEKGRSGTVNRSVVLDRNGVRLLAFEKLFAFHDVGLGTEAIVPSRVLHVLILDDILVAFGICRDFAEAQSLNPFPELDVDLIVVPSMGNRTTVDGHVSMAGIVNDRFTARTFVVQQADPDAKEQRGFVVFERQAKQQVIEFEIYETGGP